jgi:hypothetical protein
MKLKSTFNWSELRELAEKRKAAMTAELEAYWSVFAPHGEKFDEGRAVALLLHTVKRYEAALLLIAERPAEQQALMEHRKTTGQEVPASDLQRFLAYLKTAHQGRANTFR